VGELHLVKGSDPALVGTAVREVVDRLVGDGDRSLLVDEVDLGAGSPDVLLGSAMDAASTPPFLTDHRVVLVRGVEALDASSSAALIAYLGEPPEFTDLVLAAAGGRLPKALTDAWKAAGGVTHDADPGVGKARQGWLDEHLAAADVHLDGHARAFVASALGEDLGKLSSLLDLLAATFGSGARLSVADVEPYLTDRGGVPPWDLTDAIDRGDTQAALVALRRMLGGGGRHPLQVMATLTGHVERMLRLDGIDVRNEATAAEVLGLKVDARGRSFPAKKSMDAANRLGSDGIRRAVALMAGADLDLRGATALPDVQVMEVLVARLARLAPSRR
jgi:DNA polymerase III subunit delta